MNTRCKFQYKSGLYFLNFSQNVNLKTIFTDGFESMSTWDKTNNSFGHSLTALDTAKKKSGSYSGRIDDNYPRQWSKYVYSDTWTPINNSKDTYYTVSGWVYVEDVTTNGSLPNLAKLWIVTRKQGERGYPTGHISTSSTKEGTWEYLSKTVLIPADVKEINVRIENARLGKVWFDDVKIVKGNTSQTVIVEESNYYPFGLKHKGYNNVVSSNGNSTAQKKGFQEQMLDDELGLNWYSYKYRNYDPSLARFHNIDPLTEEYMDWGSYVFSGNRVIDARELEGLEPVSIHSQSFIPFKNLGPTGEGGSFGGDNRGFGEAGTSRIAAKLDLNLSGNGITMTGKSATGADTYDSDGNIITYSDASFQKGTGLGKNSFSDGTSAATDLGFHISGNNDAIFGSPDIDVKGALAIGVFDHKDGSSTAVISGEIFGDKFPANETFMTDKDGTRIFLGVSGADGSPLTSLPGNNSRTMSTFTMNVNFNSNGNATGVNYNGTNYSIENWNRRFTNLNPASNTSTYNN